MPFKALQQNRNDCNLSLQDTPGPSLEKPEFHLDQFYEAEAMREKIFAQDWMAW